MTTMNVYGMSCFSRAVTSNSIKSFGENSYMAFLTSIVVGSPLREFFMSVRDIIAIALSLVCVI